MKITRWKLDDHLKTDEDIAAMIEVALEENDAKLLSAVFGIIARKHGMSELADKTGMKRGSLYRALSIRGNPQISTLMKIIPALGLRLRIEPITA